MIRLVLVDDHHIVRNGIKAILEREQEIEVVAEASNGTEALSFFKIGNEADIVVTDIDMPATNGLNLAQELNTYFPDVKVIILTMTEAEEWIVKAFKAGVRGFISKNATVEELAFAVRHVYYRNDRYLSAELSINVLEKLLNSPDKVLPAPVKGLSKRELEILSLVAEGYTNQEIADKLFTSKRTVEGHRQNLIDKTGTRNSASLIRYAILSGLIN